MAAADTTLLKHLETGEFLDHARIRRIAAVFSIVAVIVLAALFATSDGFKDASGRPLGADYMSFYAAGKVALHDGAASAYDAEKSYAEHKIVLGEEAPRFWPFLYPPVYLFLAIGLASLPYLAGWLAFMGSTLALYAGAMQKIAPGRFAALLTLAFPAVLSNFLHGQNAFLLAALFASGTFFLSSGRSVLAGVLFGLIAVKPQYGVLIPVALAASREWRAFSAAAVTVILLALAPTIAFGPDIWSAFMATMSEARRTIIESGAIGFEKIQSVFAQARMLGAPVALAYAAQAATAAYCLAAVFTLWRGDAPKELKAAGLIVASLVASPYALDYDMVILAPAIAYLVLDGERRGFGGYEKAVLLFAAVSPAFTRVLGQVTHISAGLIAMALLMWVVERRRRR